MASHPSDLTTGRDQAVPFLLHSIDVLSPHERQSDLLSHRTSRIGIAQALQGRHSRRRQQCSSCSCLMSCHATMQEESAYLGSHANTRSEMLICLSAVAIACTSVNITRPLSHGAKNKRILISSCTVLPQCDCSPSHIYNCLAHSSACSRLLESMSVAPLPRSPARLHSPDRHTLALVPLLSAPVPMPH